MPLITSPNQISDAMVSFPRAVILGMTEPKLFAVSCERVSGAGRASEYFHTAARYVLLLLVLGDSGSGRGRPYRRGPDSLLKSKERSNMPARTTSRPRVDGVE